MSTPLTSVIICTYNRSQSLELTLRSLANQTFPSAEYEIIVVDDGSNDSTLDLCKGMQEDISNLRIFSTGTNMGLARAGNLGIKHAKGDLLLFTDDDCIADKCWVKKMTSALGRYPIIAGSIDSYDANFFQLCHNISQFHPFMPGNKSGEKDFIAGANMGFQRAVFDRLGGFKEGLPTPDMEFIIRARIQGFRIFFEPEASIIHDPARVSLRQIFSYSYQHAKATILIRNTYADFLKTPLVLKWPVLLALCAPIISLKVIMTIYFKNTQQLKFLKTIPLLYALKLAWCFGAFQGIRQFQRFDQQE